MMQSFRVIDSHTGGEPTRTIVEGGPDLGNGSVAERLAILRDQFDGFRRAIVNEPRGSDVMVGALLVPPSDGVSLCGVIFFNNVGYLGMCGHGTIGVVETLRYLDRIKPGKYQLATSVGPVQVELDSQNRVTIENVPSYRSRANHTIRLSELGELQVDIAYGGNWFCLVKTDASAWLDQSTSTLLRYTSMILDEVRKDFPLVDHVELFGSPKNPRNDSRNFVLCPGGAYDRSPCGTGTSAKLACLAADGKLEPGAVWKQESIIGSVFEGSYRWQQDDRTKIIPKIASRAFVNGDLRVLIDPEDRFAWGII